jgi:hypothetical protein
MNLTVNIGYNEILHLVKQLPASKIKQLQYAINNDFVAKKAEVEISAFQQLLLNGPIMTDEHFAEFKKNRYNLSQWRSEK